MTTIGEGVENRDQVNWLQDRGCHILQGFHFYHPMPAHELETISTINQIIIAFGNMMIVAGSLFRCRFVIEYAIKNRPCNNSRLNANNNGKLV
jgi:hypothetical protein